MSDRLSRFAPLTGVLFAVIVIVAVFTSNGESPKADARPAKVISYYTSHGSEVETSAILFALAFVVVVLFGASLRSYMRRSVASEGAAAIVLAGAVLMAAGALTGSGVEYGLAHNLTRLEPSAAQALNVLQNEMFLPVIGGAFLFGLGSGLAILRGAALPRWLGWVAIVIGVAALVPPASFPALLAFVIWSVVVSILMYLRTGPAASVPAAGGPVPVAG
jgi:hypothetical protein